MKPITITQNEIEIDEALEYLTRMFPTEEMVLIRMKKNDEMQIAANCGYLQTREMLYQALVHILSHEANDSYNTVEGATKN